MKRSIGGVCAAVSSAMLVVLIAAPTTYSAPKTPEIGSKCSAKQAWDEYSGRAISAFDAKTRKIVTTFESSDKPLNKADKLICVPSGWAADSDTLDVPTGRWELLAWPDLSVLEDITLDKVLYGITDELEPCAISRDVGTTDSPLSFFDRKSKGYLPSVGTVRGIIIPWVDNARVGREFTNPNAREELERRAVANQYLRQLDEVGSYASDYYADASQGRLDLRLTTARRLFFSEDYATPGSVIPTNEKLRIASRGGIDFSAFDFVIFDEFLGSRGSGTRSGFDPATPSSIPGINNVYDDTESVLGETGRAKYVVVHEIGHMLGLPDLYAEQAFNPLNVRFSGNMSVMHGSLKYGFRGWERWVLGWLRSDEVQCVSEPTKDPSTLEFRSLDDHRHSGSKKMIVFRDPSDPDRVFISELRAPNPGLRSGTFNDVSFLTYEVNTQSPSARAAGSGLTGQVPEFAPLVVWRGDRNTLAVTPRSDGRPLDAAVQRDDGEDLQELNVPLEEYLESEANLVGAGMNGPFPIPSSHRPWSWVSYPTLTTEWEFDLRNPDALCGEVPCAKGVLTYEYIR